VVGVDTGLVHLAAALGRPTLALYCASDPALTGVLAGPNAVNLGNRGAAPAAGEVVRRALQMLP
jgi:heptosyltransferase-1